MTVSADNPREVIKDAGGKETVIKEVLKDEKLGDVDLRGEKVHILKGQGYTDDKGIEREFVQTESGAFLSIPKKSLKRSGSVGMGIPRKVWDRIFGKKKG